MNLGPLPSGSDRLLKFRLAGNTPAGLTIVSLIGRNHPYDSEYPLTANVDQVYDWRFLAGIDVMVLLKRGINATPTLRAIAQGMNHYGELFCWDVERLVGAQLHLQPVLIPKGIKSWELIASPWAEWENYQFETQDKRHGMAEGNELMKMLRDQRALEDAGGTSTESF